MDGEVGGKSAVLWSGMAAQKLGLVVFSFSVGRAGGAEAVGVMAAVLAVVWVLSTLAGMGLPDRMTFVAAESVERPMDEGAVHSTYLIVLTLLTAALVPAASWLGGSRGGDLDHLACALVIGAGLQALSAPTLCACRGAGRPGWEVAALLPMSGILSASWWLPNLMELGLIWVLAGAVQFSVAIAASHRMAGLWPSRPASLIRVARLSGPYLGFGVGAWLIGNVDLLMARALFAPEAVGALQVGTMVLRAAESAAWVLATLSLHRLGTAGLPWRRIALVVCVLGIAAAAAVIGLQPVLAWGHGLASAQIADPSQVAAGTALVAMAAMVLLPNGAARRLGWTLRVIALGLTVSVCTGALFSEVMGVSGCILAGACGKLVVAIGLIVGLRAQHGEVGLGAGRPGVGLGRLDGEASSGDEIGARLLNEAADAGDE